MELNESTLRNMTTDELLKVCDRSKPEVKALCERLERNSELMTKVARKCDEMFQEIEESN